MRKEEIDKITRKQPFQPFEVRLVDGRVFRFTSSEQYIVSRSAIFTLDAHQDGLLISLDLIATIYFTNGKKKR